MSALMIERMDPRRPKMRSTRKHRSSRTTVIGGVVSARGRRAKSQDQRRRLVASKAGTHRPLAGKRHRTPSGPCAAAAHGIGMGMHLTTCQIRTKAPMPSTAKSHAGNGLQPKTTLTTSPSCPSWATRVQTIHPTLLEARPRQPPVARVFGNRPRTNEANGMAPLYRNCTAKGSCSRPPEHKSRLN